jgi:catechol 2,3-dioxygenase-like lactoylglutathione lyase family enzyme
MFISATDVDSSTRFYCDLLGFVPTRKFNEGLGDCQIVHQEDKGRDFDLLIVPTGTAKLQYAHHVAFEADSFSEFESMLQKAEIMGLKPRSQVPIDSEAGVSTFTMYDRTYQHFYVLDPSRINVEIMCRI